MPVAVRAIVHSTCLTTILVLFAGCTSTERAGLTLAELEHRRPAYLEQVRNENADTMRKLVRRLAREQDEWAAAGGAPSGVPAPTCDVLVVSGGADYGAFSAGILEGWGTVTHPELGRPEFDVVSGVSTGALIAPFAAIGTGDSYQRAFRLYQEPKEDWMVRRGLFFFLPRNESLMDISGLERDIRREFNSKVVRRIAEASKQGKVLTISATNLDYGQRRVWDVGREAELAMQFGQMNVDRVHKVLLASSAIPGAFPPVEIDGHLYVDGATTANILYENDMRSPDSLLHIWRDEFPGRKPPKFRYWVIVNNQLNAPAALTKANWVNVVELSLGTAVRASTATSIQHLATQLALLNLTGEAEAEFRVIAIPDDWKPPKEGIFVKETMVSLAELGLKLGREPATWKFGSLLDKPLPGSEPKTRPATAPVN